MLLKKRREAFLMGFRGVKRVRPMVQANDLGLTRFCSVETKDSRVLRRRRVRWVRLLHLPIS